MLKCPRCSFRFDISYARAMVCGGCQYVTFGSCRYVKCPKCGYEDAFERFQVAKVI